MMLINNFDHNNYAEFFNQIKVKIQNARIKATYTINHELISLYLGIGEMIVQKQAEFNWGKSVVEKLSLDLRKDFLNTSGFSVQNLWYMRQFYLEYKENSILQQLVGEIPWGHNLLIISKIKNIKEREFYIRATIEMKWSRNVLLNQIKANAYKRQKLAIKQHNFKKTLPVHIAEQADEAMKDSYMLDFLGIKEPILEKDLENKMVNKN